jgi:phasin family protein
MQSLANNPAFRSHVETQINFFTELAHRSFDSARRLSELNLRLGQQLMEDAIDTGRQMLSCTDPYQMSTLAMQRMEPLAQHLRAYQQQLAALAAGAQAGLTQAAEAHIPEAGRSAAALADDVARRSLDAGAAFASMQGQGSEPGRPNGPNGSPHTPS